MADKPSKRALRPEARRGGGGFRRFFEGSIVAHHSYSPRHCIREPAAEDDFHSRFGTRRRRVTSSALSSCLRHVAQEAPHAARDGIAQDDHEQVGTSPVSGIDSTTSHGTHLSIPDSTKRSVWPSPHQPPLDERHVLAGLGESGGIDPVALGVDTPAQLLALSVEVDPGGASMAGEGWFRPGGGLGPYGRAGDDSAFAGGGWLRPSDRAGLGTDCRAAR